MRDLFYVDALPDAGELAVVDGDTGFHATNVRRTRTGEHLDLGDGAGTVAHCVVEDVGKGRFSARVLERRVVAPPTPAVTVVQAIHRAGRIPVPPLLWLPHRAAARSNPSNCRPVSPSPASG